MQLPKVLAVTGIGGYMELTVDELIELINNQKEDFIIELVFSEEAGDGEESV